MITCPNCNTQNDDDFAFCNKCGKPLSDSVSNATQETVTPQPNVPQPSAPIQTMQPIGFVQPTGIPQDYMPNGTGRFVSADEFTVATLHNGVAMNLISGEGFRKEDAILSNKRLYYKHKEGILNVKKCEEKVDIKDITGTKITSFSPYGILILAIIATIVGIFIAVEEDEEIAFMIFAFAIAAFITFFSLCRKFLKIEYAGGCIRFSVKKYGIHNIQSFQNCIHKAKDVINNTNKQ